MTSEFISDVNLNIDFANIRGSDEKAGNAMSIIRDDSTVWIT